MTGLRPVASVYEETSTDARPPDIRALRTRAGLRPAEVEAGRSAMWEAGRTGAGTDPDLEHPSITREWVRTALREGESAFEREMSRDRKRLEAQFHRFWNERRRSRE